MASRSIKPAATSYLQSPKPQASRPPFARPSSSSSTHSNHSDDSIITGALNNLQLQLDSGSTRSNSADPRNTGGVPYNPGNGATTFQSVDDTPGRKRSAPIAIQLPARKERVYTPLSARGDLPGGYFPYHDTFSSHHYAPYAKNKIQHDDHLTPSPTNTSTMSAMSSATSSASDSTTRAPQPTQDLLPMPMGKYHPSNYKITSSTPAMPLQMPPSRNPNKRPCHEHTNLDIKRKLQDYQRGIIAQARQLGRGETASKPASPKLLPLGSPGPITPFELEELVGDNQGYMVAGAKGHAGRTDHEVIGGMILMEEERQKKAGSSGVAAR